MFTTAGSTFFTIGAKLGIGTIAGSAACACATASGVPTNVADKVAATASRRNQPAGIVGNVMDQPRLKEGAVAKGTASWVDRSPQCRSVPEFRATMTAGGLRRPFTSINSV